MTEAQTLTITDFLLARIATRESVAGDMQHQALLGRPLLTLHGGGTGIRELVDPARELARCAVDRRIVDRHSRCDDVSYGDPSTCPEMCDLASVYADHPHYRREWRP